MIMWWLLNTARPVSVLSKLSETTSLLPRPSPLPQMSRTTEVGLDNPGGETSSCSLCSILAVSGWVVLSITDVGVSPDNIT